MEAFKALQFQKDTKLIRIRQQVGCLFFANVKTKAENKNVIKMPH